MSRAGKVFQHGQYAGRLEDLGTGFRFTYDTSYVAAGLAPVSLTLPLREQPYQSPNLFACFVSMLAEGDLATLQCQQAKIDEDDYFGRLLLTGSGDVIGSVTVELNDELESGAAE